MTTQNKIALVTGGSRGLGKDMALNLAKRGIDVIITFNSRQDDALAVVKEIEQMGVKAASVQFDASQPKHITALLNDVKATLKKTFHADHFDFLINNAGIGGHYAFAETEESQFDLLMNIHFKTVFFLTQQALPLMNDGGRIINISSGLARFSTGGYAAYASMKGAIETLSRYMAKELGPRGISVNVVAPGAIETDFGGGAVRDNQQLNQMVAGMTALGRVGLPEDIGGVVAFLCSPEARWINAQRIEVSGGMNI